MTSIAALHACILAAARGVWLGAILGLLLILAGARSQKKLG